MNASGWSEIIGALFIFIGTVFTFLSAVGMIRLPDVYTRSHAASKSTTLGVLSILFGAFLYFWLTDGFVSIRLILGIFFVLLTAPVAAHMVCRSAYRTHVEMAKESVQDDLKGFLTEDSEQEKVHGG